MALPPEHRLVPVPSIGNLPPLPLVAQAREHDLPRPSRGALPYQDQRGGKLVHSAGHPLAFAIRCPEWAVRCATPGRRLKWVDRLARH